MKFSKKQIIGFIVISLIISAIPPTLYLLKQRQILKSSALEASITCHTEDPAYPDGYEYTSGALDVWVVKSDGPGSTNEIGTFSGVSIHAEADHKNEPPASSPNHARTEKDGPGCGFSADGTTDGNGYTHLEPLNCGHNNFAITATSGLPPNVIWVGSTYNNGDLNAVDISQLVLENGSTGVIKLYYYETTTPPPPIETPAPTTPPPPGETPAPTPAPVCNPENPGAMVCGDDCGSGGVGSCDQCNGGWCYGGFCKSCAPEAAAPVCNPQNPGIMVCGDNCGSGGVGSCAQCNGGWCKGGFCETCAPAATPAPTPAACIGKVCSCSGDSAGSCAQCNGGWCSGGTCKTCSPAATAPPATSAPLCPIPNAVTNIRISCPYCP